MISASAGVASIRSICILSMFGSPLESYSIGPHEDEGIEPDLTAHACWNS
jgi:hypothetical protein